MRNTVIFAGMIIFIASIGVDKAFAQTTESYQHRTPDGRTITVYYVLPPDINRETRVLFTLHGTNRNARGMANTFRSLSIAANVAVIAPEFTSEAFPNNEYQRINLLVSNRITPYSEWSFHHIDRIFNEFITRHRLNVKTYILYGHSAGSQFTHRTLMFSRSPNIEYAISANAGTYTFLNESWDYPRGIQNLSANKKELLDRLANKKLYILIGSEDNDPNSDNLDHGIYDVQGMHRYERAFNFYNAAQNYARQNNVKFNWELTVMPGVGHNAGQTVPYVLDIVTRTTRPASITRANQLSGQERIYGTWYSATSNNATIITSNSVTVVQNDIHLVVRIESIEPITNTTAATRDKFPNGYRIRGVHTESNQSGTSVGSAYNRVWYISADNRTLNRSDSTVNVWNRY